jgi:Uma2 family endonuclease
LDDELLRSKTMTADTLITTPHEIAPAQVTSAACAALVEHAVVLADIEWDQYVALRDKPGNRGLRMTYAEGVLEIMTLSSFHELISLLIHDYILEWRVARNIPVRPSGSMTLRRAALNRGLEGDQSYYIQHEPQVRGLDPLDLDTAPPPDLAVEVEHTAAVIRKMPIYASLGVPEVWRWRGETLTVHRLVDGQYVERLESEALPGFPLEGLRTALARRSTIDETTLVREFRQWLEAVAVTQEQH